MLLNRDQIQAMGLVQNPTAKSYRPASYDLQVGKIIDKSGKVVDSIEIPPQGMVRVISRERVKLPVDVIGNATVRTGLCDDGILAINIGIIDPGYEGLISSTLINFGRTEFPIKDGEVFLRLTFHQITPCKNPVARLRQTGRRICPGQNQTRRTQFLDNISQCGGNRHSSCKKGCRQLVGEVASLGFNSRPPDYGHNELGDNIQCHDRNENLH